MPLVGMATIGQAPRDDLVPDMLRVFTKPVNVVQRGALDGLNPDQIAALGPDAGEVGMVARLADGSSTLVSQAKILPRMQAVTDALLHEGTDLLVILCGADWSGLKSSRLLINPGRLFPSVVAALGSGRRLGVIKPSAGQLQRERERYATLGIDAVVTHACPYDTQRLEHARAAAHHLSGAGVDLIWMTCVGMDDPMRRMVEQEAARPVLLARTLLARVIDELLPATDSHDTGCETWKFEPRI